MQLGILHNYTCYRSFCRYLSVFLLQTRSTYTILETPYFELKNLILFLLRVPNSALGNSKSPLFLREELFVLFLNLHTKPFRVVIRTLLSGGLQPISPGRVYRDVAVFCILNVPSMLQL